MPGANNGSYKNITIESLLYTDLDKVIISIIMPIVVTIGIIGNVMTIIVIASKKCMHTPVNVYFANLAIADTMFLIVSPALIWNSYLKSPVNDLYDIGEMPNWVCPLYDFVSTTGETIALTTIFWLSIERYMAVCRPLKFQKSGFRNFSRSIKICGIIWLLCLSWNAPYLVATHTITEEVHWPLIAVNILPNFRTYCRRDGSYLAILWYIKRALTLLIIVIIVALYTAMLISLRKSRIAAASSTRPPRYKSEMKVFLTAFVTVTVYVVCIAPYYIYRALGQFKYITKDNSPLYIFYLMAYINSSVNPVIYNAMNYNFRRAFCDVYCSKCNRKKNKPTNVQI
ncbi:5-hydroxytryptamine receptor 1-like [Anneissia japonica]|uniref:5-hydroxytryptamine receptor 1-like n=1 Tax=Anneissia japonica TaxID=1529436 RepID=UPI0014254DC0|nr:5-hydroxytryptamine receptor 1-like [Anneissia japonica]